MNLQVGQADVAEGDLLTCLLPPAPTKSWLAEAAELIFLIFLKGVYSFYSFIGFMYRICRLSGCSLQVV